MKLILATNNQNKLREIREMLADTDISVASQREAGYDAEVDETGETFAENAALKARYIRQLALDHGEQCFVLADDSGLSVDALHGEPGVRSARWAGEHATDADLIDKLLREMQDVPDDCRGAHFSCVMCLIAPDGAEYLFTGKVEGVILRECRGENGFGYDPVFGYQGRSFAEIPAAEKNTVSHRYHALVQVTDWLKQHIGVTGELS